MKILNKYIILSLAAFAILGCNKDDGDEFESVREIKPIIVLQEVIGSVTGYVYDTENLPVVGAIVSIYSGTTRTDAQGVFVFENVKLDQHGTYIKIEKPGYVNASDKIFPTSGFAYSSTQMRRLTTDVKFDSREEATLEVENGGTVTFAANTIAYEDGEVYNGIVNATAYFISPTNPNIGDIMPGDLMADDALGRTVILGTAGMISVELRDIEGRKLNIRSGSKAQIRIPYTDSKYPDEIKLWSFDEDKGRWQEEGIAKRLGDFYEAEVSHFSFWNCDVTYPLINLCGRVLTENGDPVRTRVSISVDGIGTGFGYTDTNGEFCGKVPKGEILTITVHGVFCNDATIVVQKGPFDNDVVLDEIFVEDFLPNIRGQVECNGDEYSNATVLLRSENKTFVISPRGQSNFDYSINAFCNDLPILHIVAFDQETNLASPVQDISLPNVGFYTLEVCTSPCDFELEMLAPCGSDTITTNLTNGFGNYSYLWNDGSTGSFTSLATGLSKAYCVTVTENNTGCTREFCKEAVGGTITTSVFTEPCLGELFGTIMNGVPPFTIFYDNGAQETIENTNFYAFDINGSGQICFDITDGNGCTTNGCEFVSGGDLPFNNFNPESCSGRFYNYSSSDYQSGYVSDGLGNIFDLEPFPMTVDVLITGYSLKSATLYSFDGCEQTSPIQLPFFSGLDDPEVINTTCDACEDGQIIPIIDVDADCNECVYGSTVVLNESLVDVTNANIQGELPRGDYYLVALDENTNCFISHRLITIE